MLEIVRDRPWFAVHTLLDSEGGPVSDTTGMTPKCQIREKNAVRNAKGVWTNRLVADVTAGFSGTTGSILTLSLTRAQVNLIPHGDYLIDVVVVETGESLLNPEPIRVVNRPTQL